MSGSSINTWSKQPLKNIVTLISSGGTPSRKHPEYYSNNGHLWVKSKELLDTSIYDTEEHISDIGLKNSSAKYFPQNTILVAMYGANVGQLGILKQRATVNQAICGLVIDDSLANYRFIFYTLLSTRHKLAAKAHGAAQQNLNQDLIRNFDIPFPPLPTQRKIAAILSAYDDLIENNTRRIKILEETAQALYREWFVKFRFPGHEKVKMVESELGIVPEGGEVKKLGDIAQQIRRSVNPDKINPATPYIGLEHIPRKSITLSEWGVANEVKSTKLAFKKGEILFGKIRPYFHKVSVAPIDGVCSSDAIVISPKSSDYFSIVLCCVSSEEFVNHASQTSQGTKMPRADWNILIDYPVVIPPQPIFSQFNEFINNNLSHIQNMIFRNRNLRRTRDLLLPTLISGEVDVENLDIKTFRTET